MYKVILADDEPIIIEGLLKIIDWKELDCTVVETVNTALDVIKILSREQIDIIITDIKMPGMNGIELSKYVYENFPNTKIILLTGFSKFSYAQAAIQYNVVEFILKPTNIDKIVSAIEKAKALNKQVENNISKIKDLEEKINCNVKNLQCQTLEDIINGIIKKELIEEKIKEVKINLDNYYILVCKLKEGNNIQSFLDIFDLVFANKTTYKIIVNKNILSYVINDSDFKEDNEEIFKLANKIITILKNFKSCNMYIGISNLQTNCKNLRVSYKQAFKALTFSFYELEGENIFLYENSKFIEIEQEILNKYILDLTNYLILLDTEKAINEINNMFETFKNNKYNIEYIKNICILIYTKCSDLLFKDNISFVELIENPNLFIDILSCDSIKNLNKMILNCVEITLYTLNNKTTEKNSIVSNARSYIEKNYKNSKLTLNHIAKHVHVSNAYLSRLFKEKTGETISELITKIRINKAKELLRNSDFKIYEIAYEIGIDDPAYFSQLFKKITGLSPKEYKY